MRTNDLQDYQQDSLSEYKFHIILAAVVIGLTVLTTALRAYYGFTFERVGLYILFVVGIVVLMAHRQHLANQEMEEVRKNKAQMELNDRYQMEKLQEIVDLVTTNRAMMNTYREMSMKALVTALKSVAKHTGSAEDLLAAQKAEEEVQRVNEEYQKKIRGDLIPDDLIQEDPAGLWRPTDE